MKLSLVKEANGDKGFVTSNLDSKLFRIAELANTACCVGTQGDTSYVKPSP